jgi:hypothetical protein
MATAGGVKALLAAANTADVCLQARRAALSRQAPVLGGVCSRHARGAHARRPLAPQVVSLERAGENKRYKCGSARDARRARTLTRARRPFALRFRAQHRAVRRR